MAYTQEQVNAALAAELAARPNTPQADLTAYAKATYGLTDAQLNAAYDTIPGFNAQGKYDQADYIATTQPGQVSPKMVVDAANAANPYSAQNMAKVDITRQGQYVQDAAGNYVALSAYSPGFDINNPTALTYIGELLLGGGQDSTSQAFNAIATPAQKAEALRLGGIEKARLEAIDRAAGLLPPLNASTQTGQTTQAGQATKTYTPAETALYNAYRSGDIAGANRAIQEGKLTATNMQAKFGLTNDEMSWMTNNAGVKFFTPTTAVNTGVNTGVNTVVNTGLTGVNTGLTGGTTVGGKTYTQAETDLYNAYKAGNIAEFNRLAAVNKLTAGDMQSKFGLTQGEMNWITNNAGGKFYSPTDTAVTNTGGLGGLGGIAQNFANYQSIPIGAQYNPNVVGGTGSPYSQIMGQMKPFSNPYAGLPVNQPMGGYDPGLYDRILAANTAKADAAKLATGNTIVESGGDGNSTDGGVGESVSGTYNQGGMVDGLFGMNPPGPDDGAGYLDRGEYVIKKSSVSKYGRGLLDMINEGKVPAKKLKSLLG
jgi:hypothetical protein